VDTTVNPARTYHVPVDQLPTALAPLKDQWEATGQLYFQDGSTLYIAGGYGQDRSGKWQTFPLLSRIDLPKLIDGVIHGKLTAQSAKFARSPLVQATGGQLIKLSDGDFYLVMGHTFQGSYTTFEGQNEHNAEPASQTYLNEIRKLRISITPEGAMSVALIHKFEDPDEFHRRDLNVTEILSSKGAGLAAYGGVFTPESQLSYSKPVYLFPDALPVVDSHFEQKMNAYSCATLLLYDKQADTMYTTFFGGISRFAWDVAAEKFIENSKTGSKTEAVYRDGLQWSDQISTIRKVMAAGKEETTEMVHPTPLPGFLGAGAVFIPAPEILRAAPDSSTLDFAPLRGSRTFVGYLYGGIRASPYRFPYNKSAEPYNAGAVPSKSSELILRVYVQAAGR
jgi:hypothetical protein